MRTFCLVILLCLPILIHAQDKKVNESRWRNTDSKDIIDYKPVKRSGMLCSISNDNDIVVIDLKITDPGLSGRILSEGMVIWIDMDNSKSKKLGVRFPSGSDNNKGNGNNSGPSDPVALATTIELIGFISEQDRRFNARNSDNFRGAVKIDENGALLYRMVMPLLKLPLRNARDRNGTMPFNLGFDVGYIPAKNNFPKNEKHASGSALIWINDVKLASSS